MSISKQIRNFTIISILVLSLILVFFSNRSAPIEEPPQPKMTTSSVVEKTSVSNAPDYSKLPIHIPEEKFKPLLAFYNQQLIDNLQKELYNNPQWKRLIESKKMSVGLVDLNNPEQPRFAFLNGDLMMYAASLPKIAVLLATQDALEKGELEETDDILNDMRLMISKSNNQATTRLIDRLGFEKIESVVRGPKYQLYQEDKGGGLWVGKRYAASGPTNRDPLKNLSHAASVTQVCRFYYMLLNGKLVTRERSKKMLDIMENPELHHKFVNTLDRIAPNARLFRKSGTWQNWHADSILVWGEERKYILVALVENKFGEQIIRDLVVPVETAIKM
ncbi:serine hydrolase [Mangrovimonas sp. YM274]|uniref:serine hydrolase n=1 Tax=Mangrovimonas sp. YM274 TaxID=3070660 RepID=UPI0027DC2307|nr:serine hydrolase [Mangrovimonas sp. YM274]WMI69455.1 serine hydrolase [Mangrovimonas sp. YM274]